MPANVNTITKAAVSHNTQEKVGDSKGGVQKFARREEKKKGEVKKEEVKSEEIKNEKPLRELRG